MRIRYSKEFNFDLPTACNLFLGNFLNDYGQDGNGSFQQEDLKNVLKDLTVDSFITDVTEYVEEEIEMGDVEIETLDDSVNFSDASEQMGYAQIYHHVAELFFNGK